MKLRRHILPALAALALASCSDTLPYQPVTADEADGARLILTVDAYGLPSAASLSASRADDLFSASNEKETPQANEQAISDAVLVIYPYSLNDAEHLSANVTDALYFTFPDDADHKHVVNSLTQYTSATVNISGGFDDDTQYYCFAIANVQGLIDALGTGKTAADLCAKLRSKTLLQLYNYVVTCDPYTSGSNIKGFSNFVMSSVDEDQLKFHRMGDGTFKFVTHYNEATGDWEEKPIKVQRLASRVEFSFGGMETALYNDEAGYGFVNGSTEYSYTTGAITEDYSNSYIRVTGLSQQTYDYDLQITYNLSTTTTKLQEGEYFTLKFKVRGDVAQTGSDDNTAGIKAVMDFEDPEDNTKKDTRYGQFFSITKDWTEITAPLWNQNWKPENNPTDYGLKSISLFLGRYTGSKLEFDDFELTRSSDSSTNLISNADFETTGISSWSVTGGSISISRATDTWQTTTGGTQATGTFTGKGIIYPVLNEAGTGFTQDKFLLTKVSVKNVVVPNYTHGGGTYALLHRASNVYYVDGVRQVDSPSLFGLVGFNSSGYPTSWAYCPLPTKSGNAYTDYSWGDGHAIDFVTNGAVTTSVSGNDVSFTDANYFTSYYTGTMPSNRTLYPKAQAKYYVLDYLQENVPSTQNFTYLEIEGEYLKGGMAATGDNRKTIQAQTLFLRHYANAQKPSEGVMEYGVVRNTIYRLSFRVYSSNKKAAIRWYYYAGESNSSNGSGFKDHEAYDETDYWPTDDSINGKPNPGADGTDGTKVDHHEINIYEAPSGATPND